MSTPSSTAQEGTVDEVRSINRILSRMLVWSGIYLLVLTNWLFGGLRLSYIPLNYFLFIVALLIPVYLVVLVFTFRPASMKVADALFFMPLATLSGLLALLLLLVTLGGFPRWSEKDYDKVQSVESEGYQVSVYYVDYCGATCEGGTEVRQEKRLLPGLLLVRTIGRARWNAKIDSIEQDRVKVRAPATTRHEEQEREFKLKRFVYL